MAVASILVSEADPDVRRLLVVLIERLGHQAIVLDKNADLPASPDLLLLEPAAPACLEQARLARELHPGLPIVCMGALPAGSDFLFDGHIEFLEKPFMVEALERVVTTYAYSPV